MPLYDLECPKGHRSEVLLPAAALRAKVCDCGEIARQVYGYSVAITQPEADSRGMFRRFQEASHDLEHRGYRGPSLWPASKQRAQAIERANENPWQRT